MGESDAGRLGVLILGPHVTAAGPYSVDLAELTLCAGQAFHSPATHCGPFSPSYLSQFNQTPIPFMPLEGWVYSWRVWHRCSPDNACACSEWRGLQPQPPVCFCGSTKHPSVQHP